MYNETGTPFQRSEKTGIQTGFGKKYNYTSLVSL